MRILIILLPIMLLTGCSAVQTELETYAPSEITVTLPEYIGVQTEEVPVKPVTYYDLENEIAIMMREHSMTYEGTDSITDEQAAILSSQKYQTADAFIDGVMEMLERDAVYERKETVFLNIFLDVYENAEFSDLPECDEDEIRSYAVSNGMIAASDTLSDDVRATAESDLLNIKKAELVLQCMADEQGIEGGSDEAWQALMDKYRCFTGNDLDCDEWELLLTDLAIYVADNAE